MSKYIIDIPDNVKKIVYFHVGNANAVWTTSNVLDDLELLTADYINEHFSDLQDTAYQRGLEDGKAQSKRGCEGCRYECENKRRVPCILCSDNIKLPSTISPSKLKSQWTAKGDEGCEGCKYQANKELTCPCSECANNYKNQWTAKSPVDDGFVRGDVVVDERDGTRGIVVSSENNESNLLYVLFKGYRVPQSVVQKHYKKTGEHYDIDKFLDEIKGEDDK